MLLAERELTTQEQFNDLASIRATEQLINRQSIEAEAWQLIQTRAEQPPVPVGRQEYEDNARTTLMEALTASGFLSKVEISGSLAVINQQVMRRLLNGWDDMLPGHEQLRRYQEICEELTIQKLHQLMVRGELPGDMELAIISDCPPKTAVGDKLGYRFSNQKGMVRSTALRANPDGSYTRVIEQVSRSNSNSGATFRFLGKYGMGVGNQLPADVAVLSKTFAYSRRDLVDGVVDVQRQLDRQAGRGIRYGDLITDKPDHAPYAKLREISAERESRIEAYIADLASLEAELAECVAQGLAPQEATQIFHEEVDRILSAICILEPEYALETYGQKMSGIFYQAAHLEARGQHQAAAALIASNNSLKDTITFCGMSISLKEAREMGLPVNDMGDLVDKGKESWKWKRGICQVSSCQTRPGMTDVGPCSVCRGCQKEFNAGRDPTKKTLLKTLSEAVKERLKSKAKTSQPAEQESTIQS
jgi:hypothetical protein